MGKKRPAVERAWSISRQTLAPLAKALDKIADDIGNEKEPPSPYAFEVLFRDYQVDGVAVWFLGNGRERLGVEFRDTLYNLHRDYRRVWLWACNVSKCWHLPLRLPGRKSPDPVPPIERPFERAARQIESERAYYDGVGPKAEHAQEAADAMERRLCEIHKRLRGAARFLRQVEVALARPRKDRAGQPESKVQAKPPRKPAKKRPAAKSCNETMTDLVQSNPESKGWPIREWERQTGFAKSTIQATEVWGLLQEAAAVHKAEAQLASAGRRLKKGKRR